jgi:hypothetical protein
MLTCAFRECDRSPFRLPSARIDDEARPPRETPRCVPTLALGFPAVQSLAHQRLRRMMGTLLEPFGERGAELAPQFAALALSVADGAFIAHHIEPDETDIRTLFDLLRRALTALARELVTSSGEGV